MAQNYELDPNLIPKPERAELFRRKVSRNSAPEENVDSDRRFDFTPKPTPKAWQDISLEQGAQMSGNGAEKGISGSGANRGAEQAPFKHLKGGTLVWPPEGEEDLAAHARDIDKMFGLAPEQLPPIGAESLDARRDRIFSNGHTGKTYPTFGAPTHWDQEQ